MLSSYWYFHGQEPTAPLETQEAHEKTAVGLLPAPFSLVFSPEHAALILLTEQRIVSMNWMTMGEARMIHLWYLVWPHPFVPADVLYAAYHGASPLLLSQLDLTTVGEHMRGTPELLPKQKKQITRVIGMLRDRLNKVGITIASHHQGYRLHGYPSFFAEEEEAHTTGLVLPFPVLSHLLYSFPSSEPKGSLHIVRNKQQDSGISGETRHSSPVHSKERSEYGT